MPEKTHCPFCGHRLTRRFMEGHDRLFCAACDTPIYENPIPATCLVVVDDRDRILLVKRSVEPMKGYWCLPGGFVELHETPEDGALRELYEETGLSGKITRLLGVTTNPSPQYHSVLMIGYLVRTYQGIAHAGDDASDAAYFASDGLPEIAFDSHRRFIRIYYAAYSKGGDK
ncbi:MAG: NUDIX hydrolase [Deltaproteobacteria bacterium]|nr:NUDIX hydrolase [Deltaproteobacteria bacterium]